MLKKCFSAGSFVALASVAAVWIGCSSDDTTSTASPDAGTPTTPVDSGSGSTVDSGSNGNGTIGLDGGVDITYGQCSAFTKCGGDPTGTWKVTTGCLDKSTFDAARAQCQELQESDVQIQASGTVTFTATQVTRATTELLSGKVFIPTASNNCTAAKGQQCFTLGFALTSSLAPGGLKFDTANCTDTTAPSTGCNCDVTKKITDSTTQNYTTTSDGTLTTTTTSTPTTTQTYDYCIKDGVNTYVETTQGQSLKLYVSITKQ